ncbi:MAG: tetratricopeptide repeat protein [Saprospiraceae bacterium]|nr:tetratricopeptide repeat protein [Saprospiraceae bacterium]
MRQFFVFCFFIICFLGSNPAFSQKTKIDSLLLLLGNSKRDTHQVNLLIELADVYNGKLHSTVKSRELSLVSAQKAQQLAETIGFKSGVLYAKERQADIYLHKLRLDSAITLYRQIIPDAKTDKRLLINVQKGLGECLSKKGKGEEGRSYLHQALQSAQQIPNYQWVANILHAIGVSYLLEGKYNEGLDTLILSTTYCEKTKNYIGLAIVSHVLAGNYMALNQNEKALFWSKKGYQSSLSANDSTNMASSMLNIGTCFAQMEQVDSAELYLQQALKFSPQVVSTSHFISTYLSLAMTAGFRKDYPTQLDLLLRCEALERNLKNPMMTIHKLDIKNLLGNCYLNLGKIELSLAYFKEAAEIAEKWDNKSGKSKVYYGLSIIAEQKKQYAEALRYYKLHTTAKDALFNEENTEKLTQIEMNHEFAQKQTVIKAAQDQELALRDAKNLQQRLLFGFLLLGLAGGAGFVFYNYRQRQQHRQLELELASLRAQINPHFIFNCLNSIYRYTKERDTDTASRYLQKFSSLLRLVLENSRTEKITLARDLEALQLYADIEGLRFKEKLHFSVDMDPEIDPTFLEIPSMLIQPHVENAIWHGLMHRPTGGNIVVRFRQPTETLLRVEIEDNGIGRAAAAELASKSATQQKGLGQKITAERLKATGKLAHTETVDLFDAVGNAAGTRIVLDIPL